jgi:hypothetical protein
MQGFRKRGVIATFLPIATGEKMLLKAIGQPLGNAKRV